MAAKAAAATAAAAALPSTQVVLGRECEYRLEVDALREVQVKLISGSAELFGVELAIDNTYTLRDQKAAIFTWYGATLQVSTTPSGGIPSGAGAADAGRGDANGGGTGAAAGGGGGSGAGGGGAPEEAYISDETPMNSYLNIHAQLQKRRELAALRGARGPRVVVAGPTDSGKSTLCQILLNYGLRLGEKPTLVDLDAGMNRLGVPGTLSATPLDMNCLSVEDGYVLTNPLVYFYGHTALTDNAEHYRSALQQLARTVQRRLTEDPEVNASGCIINTCGMVDGLGYELLVESIQALEADVVLVLGQDRLYSRLQSSLAAQSERLSIVKLARSGGVVPQNNKYRSSRRQASIREYFYGTHALTRAIPLLSPCINEYALSDVAFYAVRDMQVSAGMLPVGQTDSGMARLCVTRVDKPSELLHSLAAVVHAPSASSNDSHNGGNRDDLLATGELDWLITSPAAGFVFVKEIREAEQKIVLLVPSPGPLPSKHLLVGSIKWIE